MTVNEVEIAIKELSSDDFSTRRVAAEKLGEFGDARGVKPLINLLGDDQWQIRNTVVESLVKIRDKNSIRPLIDCIHDKDPAIRNSAMSALTEMGEDVVEPLTRILLTDESTEARVFGASALAHHKSDESAKALIKALEDKEDVVRHVAAEALGQLRRGDAVKPLIEAMEKEEAWSRFPFIDALGYIGDETACRVLIEYVGDETLSYPSIAALGRIGDIAGLHPIADALDKSGDPTILKACVRGLAGIAENTEAFSKVERQAYFHKLAAEVLKKIESPKLPRIFVEMLKSEDTEETQAAITLLRYVKARIPLKEIFHLLTDENLEEDIRNLIVLQGGECLDEVFKALDAPEKEIQSNLIRVVGVLGGAGDANRILPFLDSHSTDIVCDALIIIGMLNAAECFDRLAGFLSSTDEDVHRSAIGGIILLEGLAENPFFERVKELARSDDERVRKGAYRILGFTIRPEIIPILIEGLSDGSAMARAAAVQSLGYIGIYTKKMVESESGLEAIRNLLLDEDLNVKEETVLALGRINHRKSNDMLAAMIGHDDETLRRFAVRAVGNARIESCVPKLCNALERETFIENRISICIALGQCKKAAAIPCLLDMAGDATPEVAAEAVIALGKIGDKKVLPKILPLLGAKSWIVRNAALGAIHSLNDSSALSPVLSFINKIRGDADEELLLRKSVTVLGVIGGSSEAELLFSLFEDPCCRYEAFETLRRIWSEGEFSINMDSIDNNIARRLSCAVLGFVKNAAAAKALETCIQDPYPSVRRAAALSLGSFDSEETRIALEKAGKTSSDPWVKRIVNEKLDVD